MKRLFGRRRSIAEGRTPLQHIVMWIVAVIFALYVFTLLYPLYWMIINSFKSAKEFIRNVYGLPWVWDFSNYRVAFEIKANGHNILQMFLNSVIVVGIGLPFAVFSSALSAYTLSKYRFRGSRAIYSFMIVFMMLPLTGSLPSLYSIMKFTGLYNTYFGLILLYGGGFGYAFLLLYNFFSGISWSYAEAAMMDGAGDFTIFLRVMLPQSVGMMLAIMIMTVPGLWGDFQNPYMFMSNRPTLTLGIKQLGDSLQGGSQWPAYFAALLISSIPTGVLYLVLNKKMFSVNISAEIKG